MKLKQLIKGIPSITLKGSKEIDILGLCNNSQLAAPGYVFFAKKGQTHNGSDFIRGAILAGASAVVTDLFDPFLKNAAQIICPNVAAVEAEMVERFYGSPSEKLLTVGITGTNGKTTCSYLMKHLFSAKAGPIGLIGTIEWTVKDAVFPSTLTTPDVLTNQKLFHEMVSSGCQSAIMEVSSHALCQKRVEGIDFDLAIFTNLTEDHLDYHHTMEEYANAKAKLFASLAKKRLSRKKYPKRAIINLDSPGAESMMKAAKVPIVTYGLIEQADVRAENISLGPDGSKCTICYQDQSLFFQTPLIGRFNVYNCLAVIAAGLSLGWDLSEILSIISTFKAVPGRLERVENAFGKNIFVDYAHTEDALKNVLETVREMAKGRVLCVFGCGGNRDKQKRPKMGSIVEKLADAVFITSDNPRGEPPENIIKDILAGIRQLSRVYIEVDRRKAIMKAIEQMKEDDVLLIAGKGHETYQVFSHHTAHFDDRIVAKEYCR